MNVFSHVCIFLFKTWTYNLNQSTKCVKAYPCTLSKHFRKTPKKLIFHISNCLFILPYAPNSWWHVHKLYKRNSNALIILQCCVITIHCNETICAMIRWMAIVKTRTTNILCICSSIVFL